MSAPTIINAELSIGVGAIDAYSRLSYTMWHALAEFIDNSTQSRTNYGSIIDDVLKQEGNPLVVGITYNRITREISIEDNSIGMSADDLKEALRIAHPTKDSKGRSKYGMGLKTAACWIGKRWKIVTCEWGSGVEYSADIDVKAIAAGKTNIDIVPRPVSTDSHYTKIIITDLNRYIQQRTEENIRGYLGSMYRFDISSDGLKIVYNGDEIPPPDEYDLDTDPAGRAMKLEVNCTIGGKPVQGWVGVLRKGGRKFGGFSLFQNQRQIQGFPNAWKPRSIFGGVDDEGANNLVAQRLTGLINLDGFQVSHTKDAILFENDEEEKLERHLYDLTKDYRAYATKRRGEKSKVWTREKIRDLIGNSVKEFKSAEMSDAVSNATLPPLEAIMSNNQRQLASLTQNDIVTSIEVSQDLKIIVSLKETSEYEPYVTIVAGAEQGTLHVIINGLHPYYASLETTEAMHECINQYIYDAIAEYKVGRQSSRVAPDSVRRLKNDLLRVQELHRINSATALQENDYEVIVSSSTMQ